MHAGVKVVTSAVKSDHLAIIIPGVSRKTSTRSELFCSIARALLTNTLPFWLTYPTRPVTMLTDTQSAFHIFYASVLSMLNMFYPLRAVTVTNRDPYFVNPKVKSLFRKCNRLMRKRRIEKTESITERISQSIVDNTKVTFSP